MLKEEFAISVRGLSKIYRIGVRDEINDSLAASFVDMIKSPVKNYKKYRSLYRFEDIMHGNDDNGSRPDIIWALKDISFSIKAGEVMGIIGRNGAGKSTLLKILTRITQPTCGSIEIRGRVSSLLEVGTGFHGELTGRENIYLNGTILGMKKKEVDAKFDRIVEFSGVEKFLDTPVKRYSSGMTVRLAFSVAAHLEPEILVIDEVLAVGDAEFQKNCIKKMQDIGKSGRTVLFVSHNMSAINMLCDTAIQLNNGHIVNEGNAHDVVGKYLTDFIGISEEHVWNDEQKAPGGEIARLKSVRICSENGRTIKMVDISKPFCVDMEYDVLKEGYILSPFFDFINEEDVLCFATADTDLEWRRRPRPIGRYVSKLWVPPNLLNEGMIVVSVGLASMKPFIIEFRTDPVVSFQVFDRFTGESARGDWGGKWGGAVRPLLKWSTDYEPSLSA